jgi:hypothetical protein
MKLETPKNILEHQSKYKDNAWQMYTLQELGNWVHLLTKRAAHRTDSAKRAKDLSDAQNYLSMMQAHIDAATAEGETTYHPEVVSCANPATHGPSCIAFGGCK